MRLSFPRITLALMLLIAPVHARADEFTYPDDNSSSASDTSGTKDSTWDELENWARTVDSDSQASAAAQERTPPPLPAIPDDELKVEAREVPSDNSKNSSLPGSSSSSASSVVARPAMMTTAVPAEEKSPVTIVRPQRIVTPSSRSVITPTSTPSGTTIGRRIPSSSSFTQTEEKTSGAAASAKNLFVEQFYMSPELKLAYQTVETDGFAFVERSGPGGVPAYSLVTQFAGSAIKTWELNGVSDLQAARSWIRESMETQDFQGVEVRKLILKGADGKDYPKYFVGHKGYDSPDKAFAEIAMVQSTAEVTGGDFAAMVRDAKRYVRLPEEPETVQVSPADFEREEKVALRMMDALDFGEKMFGPFTGVTSGQPIIWQSFGESSWRQTNLDAKNFSDLVGFYTNRVVFKGLRAPLNTVDPFVEATIAMESDGVDFKDNMKLYAGLEWRPFARNPWFNNYRPWSLPLLQWVQNYRFYVMYGERYPLKDEIGGSDAHDLIYGVQIFYEWGIDLPPPGEGSPSTLPDYIRKYSWGEYFGNYRWEQTNFGSEDDFNAWILNSSVLLGVRLPGIPLPPNPINDEFVLMPYLKFEHVNNTEFSFSYQNQYFMGAGVRWMPFRTYKYKNNEWLSKVKIFGEYIGVGKVQNAKQDGEAPNAVRWDLRFGVNISSNRF